LHGDAKTIVGVGNSISNLEQPREKKKVLPCEQVRWVASCRIRHC
jgi:hypothetical protein